MEYVLNIISFPGYNFRRMLSPFLAFGRHLKDHFVPHERNNYHPHILGHRALGLFSALLVTVKVATIVLISVGPVLPAYSSAITEQNIISLTNSSRHDYSLNALTQNSMLDKAAQQKADDMLAKGYFAHVTPDGKTPWDFITGAGYNYLSAGENLAVNFSEAENVETAWMNSPEHKANILNQTFQEIGIGISEGMYQGHTAIFVVQEFGNPAGQKVSLSDTPTKVQTQSVPVPPVKQVNVPISNPAPAKVSLTEQKTVSPAPAAAKAEEALVPTIPAPLAIQNADVKVVGDSADITVQTSDSAVKVIAQFGQQAIMLYPKSATTWEGSVPVSQLTNTGVSVSVKAFDIASTSVTTKLADFAPNAVANYNIVGNVAGAHISILGKTFDPKVLENRFYLLFIAGILASMIFAIGIRRHIQHLSLIANSSFVAIFACLLYMVR